MMQERSVSGFLAYLVESGRTSVESASRATAIERESNQPIDIILRELGLLQEVAIATALADYFQVSMAPKIEPADANAPLEAIGVEFAADKAIVPRPVEDGSLVFAMANPLDHFTLDAVDYFFEQPFRLEVVTRSAIEDYFRSRSSHTGSSREIDDIGVTDVDLQRLQDIARDAPVVKLVSRIIQRSVDEKATDIHVEPGSEVMHIRFRRDGILTAVESVPLSLHAGVISRLKILARLNIAERRLPQDGRVRLPVRGQDIDFRLSVVPTIHGETVVLRILDRETIRLDLGSLGYDQSSSDLIRDIVRRPNGMVLVTGPTGSGKTTTLYSILAELNRPEVKIFTVEDPVEYRLAGITQVQIDPSIGLTFASTLRSVLRQDPDIILVGEIRDRETAEIAVQAALTGHLVLSTLHTNSAVGCFSRLRDMGVEPFLLEATVRGVIGQRLVRRCCDECRELDNSFGCAACGGTGFKGRQAAFEILTMSEPVRAAVAAKASNQELEALARNEGMIPLADHARHLAERGVTTMAEAIRVVELEAR
ncbi:GspE/PulE family protein [Rhizobium sp.]|uniref:GspE/PulE family protein n=1 Tax=Rhizobium sp. TaxID=391 RepID=UPI00289A3654